LVASLIEGVRAGRERAIARAITAVENGGATADQLLAGLYPHTGRARIIGLTGPPGAGKSTLTDRLVSAWAGEGQRVGVIAVDPTSPFSGGAVLGDRVRMRTISGLKDVFVRSMATRGALGGLNRACVDVVDILDAAGMDTILIETVGVGQDEVDIVRVSDVTVLVLLPGMGDEIQAMKAGVMEIADVFVINKADQPGLERLRSQLDYLNMLSHRQVPIVETVATTGQGMDALVAELSAQLEDTRQQADRLTRLENRAVHRLRSALQQRLMEAFWQQPDPADRASLVSAIARRELDPYQAADQLIQSRIASWKHQS